MQVPRSYHNGIKGTFMNMETHNRYFRDIGYNTDPAVRWEQVGVQASALLGEGGGASPAFLLADSEVYEYRVELLVAKCSHISAVTELLNYQGMYIYCSSCDITDLLIVCCAVYGRGHSVPVDRRESRLRVAAPGVRPRGGILRAVA